MLNSITYKSKKENLDGSITTEQETHTTAKGNSTGHATMDAIATGHAKAHTVEYIDAGRLENADHKSIEERK